MTTAKGFNEATKRDGTDPFLTLIAFQSPELSEDQQDQLRIVLNGEGLTHNGDQYYPSGFQYRPPALKMSLFPMSGLCALTMWIVF